MFYNLVNVWSNVFANSPSEVVMALASHLEQLKAKHSELESQLEEAMKHPGMRDDRIHEIKRQKLMIKDKIENMTH